MKEKSTIIVVFGTVLAALSIFARLSTFGFFYLIGLSSSLLFGILHLIFLNDLLKYYDRQKSVSRFLAWSGVIVFPLVFLFQFDLEEYKDSFYVYEFLTGEQQSDFEFYAFYIAIAAGLIYLINFALWKVTVKKRA